ncbi:MAG: hypothetical protein ACI30B_03065 [Paludibacteraceae bacterium]
MKKIIFLAFTVICILLTGCETNEPPQQESETQVIFCWEPQDTLSIHGIFNYPDGKVRFVIQKNSYSQDEDPQVAGFTFTNKQFNVDTFNLVSNRDYQLCGYNDSNECWLLADFTPKGQMQKYRIHFDYKYGSLLLDLTDFK